MKRQDRNTVRQGKPSGDHGKPPEGGKPDPSIIYSVRIHSSPAENQRNADQTEYQRRQAVAAENQVTIARSTRIITAAGTSIALVGTIYVMLTFGANRRAARATERAVTIASNNLDAFKAVEAAQITVEFSPTVKMGTPGQGILVDGNVDLNNVGQTTAIDLSAKATLWEHNLAPPKPGVPGIVSSTSTLSNSLTSNVTGIRLGGGKTAHLPVSFQLGKADEIKSGTMQAGIVVDIDYSDVFGHTYPHSRECFMFSWSDWRTFVRCPSDPFN